MRVLSILAGVAAIVAGATVAQADSTVFSQNGASCIPTGDAGVSISAGALTNTNTGTMTCYVPVGQSETDAGAVNRIEIVAKGTTGTGGINTTCSLLSMAKSSGAETTMGTVTGTSSTTIVTTSNALTANSFDWTNNFYYIRCTLHTGTLSGQTQTLFGVSLTFR